MRNLNNKAARYPIIRLLREDWSRNHRNPRGILVCILYRLAHSVLFLPIIFKPFGYIYIAFYKFITEYILGTEIHWRSTIGGGLHISHGYGLVVHSNAKIGSNCILRHGVTIGIAHKERIDVPTIGDDVEFGANSIAIGSISIGNNVLIGAGAVVTTSIPDRAIVAGNPSKIIKYKSPALLA